MPPVNRCRCSSARKEQVEDLHTMAVEREPKTAGTAGSNEAQIAVHWKEEDYVRPAAAFAAQANLSDARITEQFAERNFPDCFEAYAELLTGNRRWEPTLDTGAPPFWKWFDGGTLNACYNCVDRHLAEHKTKAAFIFIPELEE